MLTVKLANVVGIPGKTRRRRVSYEPGLTSEELAGVGFVFPEPVLVSLTLTGQAGGALVALEVAGRGRAECGRCLTSVEVSVCVSHHVMVAEGGADCDDVLALGPDNEVDLAPTVDQLLAVALPMRVVCRDDCRGLCAVCGSDLNRGDCGCDRTVPDPRLAVFKDLELEAENERE